MCRPCLWRAFDNERTAIGSIAIMVRVQWTMCAVDKTLRQGVEHGFAAKPGKMVGEVINGWRKCRLVGAAHHRIQAICTNDNIRVQSSHVIDDLVIADLHTQFDRPLFQKFQ